MRQLEITLEGGLRDQFPEFWECVQASESGCGRQHKAIAADLDMSPSELSRKLANNPDDPLNFPLRLFPALLRSTRDLRPLYWLIEEFCEDDKARASRVQAELAAMLPKLQALLVKA